MERENILPENKIANGRITVIVMLGAKMEKTNNGGWKFSLINTDGQSSDPWLKKVSGGFSRMRGLAAFCQNFKANNNDQLIVLVTGGKDAVAGISQSEQEVNLLTTKYKIKPEAIKSIGEGKSTLANAEDTFCHIERHKELNSVKTINILTNNYHGLRSWLIFYVKLYEKYYGEKANFEKEHIEKIKKILSNSSSENDPAYVREQIQQILQQYFQDLPYEIRLITAEEMLTSKDCYGKPIYKGGQKYRELIEKNKWVRQKLKIEYQGVLDLLENKYKQS